MVFQRLREALVYARRRKTPPIARRKVRLTWLAKLHGLEEADVDLLRELASNGELLEELTRTPGWATLLELKEEMQAVATEQTRGASSTPEQRRDGAMAYWTLEGLFGAVYRTINNGQKARLSIRETIKTVPT